MIQKHAHREARPGDLESSNFTSNVKVVKFFLFKFAWSSKSLPINEIKLKTFVTLLVTIHTLYLQGWDVIVWDKIKARHKRAKTFRTAWVCRAGDSRHGSAPEVSI